MSAVEIYSFTKFDKSWVVQVVVLQRIYMYSAYNYSQIKTLIICVILPLLSSGMGSMNLSVDPIFI